MNIQLPLETDSDNSYPTGTLDISRGRNRPDNVVLILGDRVVEVNLRDLYRSITLLLKNPA